MFIPLVTQTPLNFRNFKIVISQRKCGILPSIFLKLTITFKDLKLDEKNSLTFSESKFPLNISGANRPFWLGCLFFYCRPCAILQKIVLLPSKNYSVIYMRLFGHLKVRILKSIITSPLLLECENPKLYGCLHLLQYHIINILKKYFPLPLVIILVQQNLY